MRNELLGGFYPTGEGPQNIQREKRLKSQKQRSLKTQTQMADDPLDHIRRLSNNADQMFKPCGCRTGKSCPCDIAL